MSMPLAQLLSTAAGFFQNNRIAKIQEEHLEAQRKLVNEQQKHLQQMRDQISQFAMQPMQPMQTMQMQGLQPLVLLQPGQMMQAAPAQPTEQVQPAQSAPAVEPAKQAPYSKYLQDYGQQTRGDVSIGCIPCTRAHLSTIAGALAKAKEYPDGVALAREEIAALFEYDLTPEKLAQTPEVDREILAKYATELDRLRADLSGPAPEITVASGSLKEAMRFARADGVQHPEVQLRMARTEELVNALERVNFSPERLKSLPPEEQARVKAVLPKLREARQDLINNVRNADDLESVTVRIAEIDKQLNPLPDQQHLEEAAERARALNSSFRKDVISAWTKEGAH